MGSYLWSNCWARTSPSANWPWWMFTCYWLAKRIGQCLDLDTIECKISSKKKAYSRDGKNPKKRKCSLQCSRDHRRWRLVRAINRRGSPIEIVMGNMPLKQPKMDYRKDSPGSSILLCICFSKEKSVSLSDRQPGCQMAPDRLPTARWGVQLCIQCHRRLVQR